MPRGRAPPPGFLDHHPSHRLGAVRLGRQLLPEAGQPPLQPAGLDPRERHPVDPRRPLVRTRQGIGMAENVVAMDLVGEQVEAEVRFRLRLEIELSLKRPDPFRCLQAHRQSPILCFFVKRTRSQGPCLHRRYPASTGRWPCPAPARAVAQGDVEVAPLAQDRSPPLPGSPFRRAMPTTPAGPERVLMSVASPLHAAFPETQAGRHPRLHCRGLLRLHSRYGPPDRSAQGGLGHEASTRPVARPCRSSATRPNRQLSGWILPPRVNRALAAH
jgi:hypothetical protein